MIFATLYSNPRLNNTSNNETPFIMACLEATLVKGTQLLSYSILANAEVLHSVKTLNWMVP